MSHNSKSTKNTYFKDFYEDWINTYKVGAVRRVTLNKYKMSLSWLKKLAPKLKLKDLNRVNYQKLLNEYAETHEKQTTTDFHHLLKSSIYDAIDEGLVIGDPTRKAIIKGKAPREKKNKYLNQFELHSLLSNLELEKDLSWDWLILLIAKTGLRFSEAVALTPSDFDFVNQTLSITKTYDYKYNSGYMPTKNTSSNRKIQIDWQTSIQFATMVKNLPLNERIFNINKVFNSTINNLLKRRCKKAGIPVITIHGLRHTHASILLYAGVSIASVAKRLGHSNMATTQKVYLHIIQELESKDIDLIMRSIVIL